MLFMRKVKIRYIKAVSYRKKIIHLNFSQNITVVGFF